MKNIIWKIEKHIRRWFSSFDSSFRNQLYKQKQNLAVKSKLTKAELKELDKINIKLGNFARRPKMSNEENHRRKQYADKPDW